MACRKESLLVLLNQHRALTAKLKSVRYLHVVRAVITRRQTRGNKTKKKQVRFADETSETGPADAEEHNKTPREDTEASPRTAIEQQAHESTAGPDGNTDHETSAADVDPAEIHEEKHRRLAAGQDEEVRWANVKAVLIASRESPTMTKVSVPCSSVAETPLFIPAYTAWFTVVASR
ncbi:unnamed protein product [Phytophthora lilii]|uniref:Unnamed protein product n=1 Tax=Phytophthora lilii TaxID=2077276 RepID=A0A9W6WL39_9STRA|nr:unnamed protein product [Phytophthora lilii]